MSHQRGAAPVAHLDELPPTEARLILALRHWCEGPEAQAELWNDIALEMGPARGRHWLSRFEELLSLVLNQGRRPMMRHGLGCRCVGADEAVFAHFVSLAATGEREEAMLVASLLIRADLAPIAVSLAQQLGLAGEAATRQAQSPRPAASRLH